MATVTTTLNSRSEVVRPRETLSPLSSFPKKVFQIFWDIILFPAGLCHYLQTRLQNLVFRVVVPGNYAEDVSIDSAAQIAKQIFRLIFNPNSLKVDRTEEGRLLCGLLKGEQVTIPSSGGALLDGIWIPGTHKDKAVIFGGGNVMQWETSGQWLQFFTPIGASVLMVNPRGVGKSTGLRSPKGYAQDYFAAFEHLVEKGFDPEKIVCIGFSMGGANLTRGAALAQKKYYNRKIKAVSINSFSSLKKVVLEKIKSKPPLLKKGISFAMNQLDLDIPVTQAWNHLRGKKCIFFNNADDVIPHAASLAEAAAIGTWVAELTPYPPHNRGFYPYERKAFYALLRSRDMLNIPQTLTESVKEMTIPSLPIYEKTTLG